MKKNEGNKVDWDTLQMNADKVLGDNFWSNFENLMPKKIPPIDFYETEEGGFIFVEAPGITKPEKIQINVHGAHITIQGEFPYPYPVPKEKLYRRDRFFGPFSRTITIPFVYDQQNVKAAYSNGILYITIKKINDFEKVIVNVPEK